MRFHAVVLITILAGCNQHPHAGEDGFPCRDWPAGSQCDEWLRCLDDTCVPCGDLDGICCNNIGGFFCNESTCDNEPDTLGVCQDQCGSIGQDCCSSGNCPGGGVCNSDNKCEGEVSDPCFGGDTVHPVTIIYDLCAASPPILFKTNTLEEAEECRQKLVDMANPDEEVCPLGQSPDFTRVCDGTGTFGGADLWHCSAEQLASCEEHLCDTCNWTTGDCPQ